jgi:hypothetical protein
MLRKPIIAFFTILFVLGGSLLLLKPSPPMVLKFLKYSSSGTNQIAWFCLSNRTSKVMWYFGDGPCFPHYAYLVERPYGLTNYNAAFSITNTILTLKPACSVSFPVPVSDDATDAVISISYNTTERIIPNWIVLLEQRISGTGSFSFPEIQCSLPKR